ncbi:sodium:proton exchanger [Bacillus mobilis]|uniref:Sodium:proton exchanger n=2 Tax=Bacillus cereus group TaxID=86661 RepID=A0A1C4CB69_BACCE|nr:MULTISPECIES: sodium:proton exchanger [Bacillus cereus group]OKA34360.1 sodium:proton exchanger [Bacillus cereus]OKA38129.1 sodium:proton exchanger [Bacillus cereus]SCC16325.1 Uncharacterized protein BC0861_02331 [Bacillus mobilis]
MSNHYYDRSHKCYRKKRKKCDCDCHREPRYQTLTSGPLFRNVDTDFIQVSVLNQTDEPQTVTIAVQNYQDTYDGGIYPSYGYLCGELINEDNGGSDDTARNGNGGCIYCEPEGVTPFIGPVTINTWGINFAGVIQQGNTVLNGQFTPGEPIQPQDPF